MRRTHTYKVDTLVIGSDLAALMYAYLNDYTFVFDKVIPPTPFEFLPIDFPVYLFNHDPIKIEMQSIEGPVHFGTPKIELWSRLIFIMSAAGRLPFGTKDVTIRQKEKSVTIKTKSRNYYYEVGEVKKIKNTHSRFQAFDWIDVRSCGENNLEYVKTKENFISEIFFYPSQRHGTHKTTFDILAISDLTAGELEKFDYCETMARIRVRGALANLGIKGPRNGKNPTYPRSPEKYKYAPIKLEHNHREIRAIKTNNSEQDIVNQFLKENNSLSEDSYLYRFSRRISNGSLLRTW
jgi:hypothetical protein